MSDKPLEMVRIDDLASNLRSTMARVGDVFSPSMRRQLAQIVANYLRLKLRGEAFMHPGMAKMGRWGDCHERQARRNFAQLRAWGVVEIVAYPRGGRRSSRFVVHFGAIKRLLVEMGANPSLALCEKLNDAQNPDINPDMNRAKNPDMCPDTMSAGIHTDGEGKEDPSQVVIPFRRGRA